MQREIKFRMWDSLNQKMIYQSAITSRNEPLEWDEKTNTYRRTTPLKKYIPMVFTGKTDKNGKEIFIGDIVQNLPDPRLAIIDEDEHGYFAFMPDVLGEGELAAKLNRNIEIIGNIYEHSHILQGQVRCF